jgi:hypothetical protein
VGGSLDRSLNVDRQPPVASIHGFILHKRRTRIVRRIFAPVRDELVRPGFSQFVWMPAKQSILRSTGSPNTDRDAADPAQSMQVVPTPEPTLNSHGRYPENMNRMIESSEAPSRWS